MSPMQKSVSALAAAAMLAGFGYAAAQSTDSSLTDPGATTTQTTSSTQTQVIPAPPTGVVDLAKPKNTEMPADPQPNGAFGQANNVMTTGLTTGATQVSIGDHATPPIPAEPTVIAVTTEQTTTTTTTPAPEPAAAPVPEPEPAPAAAEPMPAPRADRN